MIDLNQHIASSNQTSSKKKIDFNIKHLISSLFKLSDKDKESFYYEFHTLLKAGVPYNTALEILIKNTKSKTLKKHLIHIASESNNGVSLSNAMLQTNFHEKYETKSINIGEQTGKLDYILYQLSDYFKNRNKIKKAFSKIIAYPGMMLLLTFGALIFISTTVFPLFKSLYESYDATLPTLTKFFISFASFITVYKTFLIVTLVFLMLIFISQKNKAWFKKITSNLILKTPFVGDLYKKIHIAKSFKLISLMLKSSTTLRDALSIVVEATEMPKLKESLIKLEEKYNKGYDLNVAMKEDSFFNQKMRTLIEIGETTKQLDSMFEKLVLTLDEEIQNKIDIAQKLLPLILMSVVGVVIITLMMAVYMPMLNLNQFI